MAESPPADGKLLKCRSVHKKSRPILPLRSGAPLTRKTTFAAKALAAALGVATALAPIMATAQTIPAAPEPAAPPDPGTMSMGLTTAVGLGALAGVVGFNVFTLGVGALPGGMAYGVGMVVPAKMSVAMSRVYATASAVTGALVADYIYTGGGTVTEPAATESGVHRRLLAAGAGAITGAVAFNLLTTGIGTVPGAGAALAAVPLDVALGSRMVAAVSAGAGAMAGAYAYDAATGESHDTSHMLSLAAGVVGGISVGNWLAGWNGILPTSAAASVEASALGTYASAAAQAASRVHVVGAGVLGAWVADALYGLALSSDPITP